MWADYHQGLESLEAAGLVRRPIVPPDCGHNAHMYYLLLPSLATRTTFIGRLKTQGIQSVFHYVPLHSSPMGLKVGRSVGDLSTTDHVGDRLVRLPLWLGLEDHMAYVIQEVIAAAS